MRIKRIVGCALAATVATAGLALGSGTAGADVEGTLVTCTDSSSGVDIGDATLAPGITTVERKNTISGFFNALGCTADEAELDEIAAESRFGVTKTAAQGRPLIGRASATFKFTTYGDCLGIIISDPDDTGEYRPTGTITLKWRTASGGPVSGAATSTAFGVLTAGVAATIDGMVTKGLGVGADLSASSGFFPQATDDTNNNNVPDFTECVLGDPTAVGKKLDVVTPASLTISLPITP